ncbi:hypothetical protein PV327_004508 [Microctonus hyperodae]|uniref:SET domain-containing protein n=1 Tax=Microctonus hyperodae TaxID=165561 RepID=A0AA39KMN5_MICHY|nr:hypothetical protein PV327_004508 [Microctonus hyperodae]
MEESDAFYRALCSSETIRSATKGFFREFSDMAINNVGDVWIIRSFGRLTNDSERVRCVFTDIKIKDMVQETFGRIKHLYRDKDALLSKTKRNEGFNLMSSGNNEKALLCFSQAVLRAPINGKVTSIDQGFSLSLALLGRADALMALGDYEFALEDLKVAMSDENLSIKIREQLDVKLQECQMLLDDSKKIIMTKNLLNDHEMMRKNYYREPLSPELTGGPHLFLNGLSKLVEVRETPNVGKHAVAADNIKIGDTVVSEIPLASCLLPEYYGTHCHHCFVRLRAPLGCPVCSCVAFCQQKCRTEALETYHKYECKILALLIGSGMSILSMLALRMVTQIGLEACLNLKGKIDNIIENDNNSSNENSQLKMNLSKSAKRRLRKKKLNANSHEFNKSNDNTALSNLKVDSRAYALVDHNSKRTAVDFLERTLMAAFLLKCLKKVDFFRETLELQESPSEEEIIVGSILLKNLQLLQFNAHEISETRLGNEHRFRGSKTIYLGVAIYPSAARFNHDCYPAVTRYFTGRTIVLRAIRPLKPGEVIAENYGPIFTKRSLKERCRSLAGRYWFRCTCRACTENWPCFDNLIEYTTRLRCTTENCPGLLLQPRQLSRPVKCLQCQRKINLEDRVGVLRDCEEGYSRGFDFMENEQPAEAMNELIRALEKFHMIASPPHRETHLAEIAFASCMANSGNTWQPC